MQKPAAAVASVAFFVVAPGTMVALVPWLITRWRLPDPAGTAGHLVQGAGVVLIVAGLVPVVHAFAQFARAGGTPAPVAPTQHLVVTGFNRYLRNPMYAGLVVVIVGQAMLFANGWLLVWAAVFWGTTASFVLAYEEPTLTAQFGAEYLAYRQNVRAWWPRLRPWTPGSPRPDRPPL